MQRAELFRHVINYFEVAMPVAETELRYQNPYELLIAVILSAQCTDKRVNIVTPQLFKRFPDFQSMSVASVDDVRECIKSISYPNSKAKYLVNSSKILVEKFNGEMPDSLEELTSLPGVGRKTANVILSVIFKQPAMAVDTHVHRVAARIGLTAGAKTPLQTEAQLVKYIPLEKIATAHHWLILHGRYICLAHKPLCNKCGLTLWCKYYIHKVKTD